MQSIVIIADDLTGAADTAVQFSPFFDNTVLLSYLKLSRAVALTSPSFLQATAVYTNSRALGVNPARRRLGSIAQRLSQSEPQWIYKKVDSCLRGNLGVETEALMDALDYELSIIAPAFPEMGRITVDGVHRVHGIPVGKTEISRDPVTPVTESSLFRVVDSQTRYRVGHVAWRFLENNETGLQREIERQISSGIRHIVFDTTSRAHLDRIASLVGSSSHRMLPVGSAGLAASFGNLLFPGPVFKGHEQHFSSKGNHLLVCGTQSEVTRQQISALIEVYPYEKIALDPGILAAQQRSDALLNTVSLARSKLCEKHVVITIDSPQNTQIAIRQPKRQQVTQGIATGLGRLTAAVLAGIRPGLLFLTGGDTADAVLTAVEAEGLQLFGELVTGVVQGTILGGPLDGLPVVTKAGAFGRQDTLIGMHNICQKSMMEKADEGR